MTKHKVIRQGGQHSIMDSILASGPSSPKFESQLQSFFFKKIIDVAAQLRVRVDSAKSWLNPSSTSL